MRVLGATTAILMALACGGVGSDAANSVAADAAASSGDATPIVVPASTAATDGGPRPRPEEAGLARDTPEQGANASGITNPRSGAKLMVYVDLPAGEGPFPGVVMMPAGFAAGGDYPSQAEIAEFTSRGYAVVRWDPDGRGQSGGQEDAGGLDHQEGLREVIRLAIDHPRIADDQVGVVSYSMGISAASQALATDNPGAVFLIDWEGPASRIWTAGCGQDTTKKSKHHGACDDDSYWQYREASAHIGKLRVPYQRVQSARDHVHKADWGAAKEMVDAAIAGGVPWVRLNDAAANTPGSNLGADDLPALTKVDRPAWIVDYVEDLFMVARGGTPPARTHEPSAERASSERQGPQGGGRGRRGGKGRQDR